MGLLNTLAGPLADRLANASNLTVIAAAFFAFLVLAVVTNVLRQLLLKDPLKPPVVFHWFPFLGNTIVYGIDPYKFFFSCREKVSRISQHRSQLQLTYVVR